MKSTFICTACEKKIDKNAIFFEGYPYHRNCIRCSFNYETNNTGNIHSDFIQVVPGIFFCAPHYDEYLRIQKLPTNILNIIKQKHLHTIIPSTFCAPPILGDAIVLDKPYEVFLPKVQYHFDKNINDVDFIKLQEFLGDDVRIVKAKSGSFIFDVILIPLYEFIKEGVKIAWKKIKQWAYDLIEKLTVKLLTNAGELIVGKIIGRPYISIPDEKKINDFLSKPSFNSLKIQYEAREINLNSLMLQVVEMVRNEHFPQRAKYFINLEQEYEKAKEQIIEDNKMCKYEIKVIDGYRKEDDANPQNYNKTANRFAYDEIKHIYLYHGNNLNGDIENKSKILLNQSDKFLLNSFYLSDSIFYSCFSGKNKYGPLKINQGAHISYCKVLYNKYLLENIKVLKKNPRQIIQNKGAIVADIGDSNNNFLPIDTSQTNENNITCKEFIINDINQILPLYSFRVVRKDYYILWKSDRINEPINVNDLKALNDNLQVNIYGCKTDEEAIEIIQRKRSNRLKLIVDKESDLIRQAREIIGSKFLCFIFYDSGIIDELEGDTENVIFSSNREVFVKFCREGNVTKNFYEKFSEELQKDEENEFNINLDEIASFPHYEKEIQFNSNITIRNFHE